MKSYIPHSLIIDIKYRLLRFLLFSIGSLPFSLRLLIGRILGLTLFAIMPKIREVAKTNISIAFSNSSRSERQDILYNHFINLGLSIVELAQLWTWKKTRALSLIKEVHGDHVLSDAIAENHGVILYTAHVGAWEAAVLWISSRWNISVLYKDTKDEAVNKLLTTGRGRAGATLIPKSAGLRPLLTTLKDGGLIGILPDQNVSCNEGIFAPFFGRLACTTTLVPRLARRFGSPVISVFCVRLPDCNGLSLYFTRVPMADNISDYEGVSLMNISIENIIRIVPEQYWWVHKRYKEVADGLDIPYK